MKKEIKYISYDGKAFDTESDCIMYEYQNSVRKAFDTFSLTHPEPNCARFVYHTGHHEEFIGMCNAIVETEINYGHPENPVIYVRDLRKAYQLNNTNGHRSAYEAFFMNHEWVDGQTYLVYLTQTMPKDSYGTTYLNFIVDIRGEDSERKRIKKEIERFNALFNTTL